VFAPIDLVVTVGATLAVNFAERSDVLSVFLWTSGTALDVAGTTLSLVFFSGVVDRIVAQDQKGEDGLPIREILSGLPTLRLIVASLLAAAFTVVGLVLLLVPGFVCMILFAVVGPVIVGGVVGVLEVTLAHALISDRRSRREAPAEAHSAAPAREVPRPEAEPQSADR
jgi:hypothetical protein